MRPKVKAGARGSALPLGFPLQSLALSPHKMALGIRIPKANRPYRSSTQVQGQNTVSRGLAGGRITGV
jgi:hypothetical protein